MALDEIKSYMIGVIMFIVVIIGGLTILTPFTSIQPDTGGEITQFNKTLNKGTEVTIAVKGVEQSVAGASSQSGGPLGWLNALVGSAYNGLKAISGSMSFVTVAAEESAGIFGIPTVLVTLITLIITIIIAFAIWSAITKT